MITTLRLATSITYTVLSSSQATVGLAAVRQEADPARASADRNVSRDLLAPREIDDVHLSWRFLGTDALRRSICKPSGLEDRVLGVLALDLDGRLALLRGGVRQGRWRWSSLHCGRDRSVRRGQAPRPQGIFAQVDAGSTTACFVQVDDEQRIAGLIADVQGVARFAGERAPRGFLPALISLITASFSVSITEMVPLASLGT